MASFLDNLIIFSKSDSGAVVFSVLFLLVVIALLVGLVFLFRFFVRRFATDNAYFNHQVFLIRLPKEKPQDENKDFSLQQMREEIARGETIFASIGGLKAQRGFTAWLLGRNDHFAFEIVANHHKIAFYAVAHGLCRGIWNSRLRLIIRKR